MRRVSGCCSLLQGLAACLSGDLPNSLVRLPLPCWHPWVGVRMAQGGWDLVTSLEASPWEGQELWPPPPGLRHLWAEPEGPVLGRDSPVIQDVFLWITGSNGPQKFCIDKVGKETWLPRSHTW